MVKVPQEEYNLLKNKMKFLEYYWSEYRRNHRNYQKFESASTIRRYIAQNKYEELTNVKFNRFTKTVSLSTKQFADLKKYARIARKLEIILNIGNLSE